MELKSTTKHCIALYAPIKKSEDSFTDYSDAKSPLCSS